MSNYDKLRGSWAEEIDPSDGYKFPNGGIIISLGAGDLDLVYFGDEEAGRAAHTFTVADGEKIDYVLIKEILDSSTLTAARAIHLAR